MPEAGAYDYLKRLLVGSPIPTHLENYERPSGVTGRMARLLTPIAVIAALALVGACAVLLWLSPWPVDVLAAVGAAVGWTAWLDRQDPA